MDAEQELFEFIGRPGSIVEYLNSLSFDELVEMDLFNNRIQNLFHVEGKYFIPMLDGPFKDLYRYSSENMIHPDDKLIQQEFMNHDTLMERLESSKTPGVISEEFRYRLQSGEWRWVKQVIIAGEQHGLPEGVVRFYVFDIQNRKERELGNVIAGQHNASPNRDGMTGLRRERAYFAAMRDLINDRKLLGWCLIALDIDQFKLFNEWYGRVAGDFVLAKIGRLLVNHEIEDGWHAGYLGQDDFCIVMPHSTTDIEALCAEIVDIIAEYGTSMSFAPRLGVCMVDESDAVLDLLDRAKLAADAAKNDFKHRIRYFEPEMLHQTDAEYRLLTEFHEAIANREIFFAVQPQCRLSTGQIIGAEALARWRKASGEFVPPDEFVPVLEKYGFITDLDRYIWDSVCAKIRSWIDAGHDPVPISVNVSRNDIYSMDVAKHFDSLLSKYDLPASLIKIEITESAYVDDTGKINETVLDLRKKGFLVFIDDFGSGYSSLNMLDSINVDVIKLDMRFLHMNEKHKKKSVRILESTISMAKALGLAVITEGVETAEQAEFLGSIGCRYVQGYHLYRPMACEDFEALISEESRIDHSGLQAKPNDEFQVREFLDQNVINDAMLNNILGPLAIVAWQGDDVNIVRFNEQFYEELGIDHLENHLEGNQNYVDKKDLDRYWDLIYKSLESELNGVTDVIRYRKSDGTPFDLLMRFYFIGESDGSKRFYATIRNVTQITELHDELRLMSMIAKDTIAFLKYREDGWHFNVGIHGLKKELGISPYQLERELETRAFFDRLDSETGARLRALSHEPDETLGDFTMPLDIRRDDGTIAEANLGCYCVQDGRSVIAYILVLRMR